MGQADDAEGNREDRQKRNARHIREGHPPGDERPRLAADHNTDNGTDRRPHDRQRDHLHADEAAQLGARGPHQVPRWLA